MNKLIIKDISIVNKNKKKTTGIKLENKDHKFILYSYSDEIPPQDDNFIEFSFEQEFSISSKKRMNDLQLKIEKEENYNLTFQDKKVFYINEAKPILTHDYYKLILKSGDLYNNEHFIEENKIIELKKIDKESNLVDSILNKKNDIILLDKEEKKNDIVEQLLSNKK